MRIIAKDLVAIALVGCICSSGSNLAQAQIPKGDITIQLEPVASGLTAPVGVTHAGDGSGRLFIWEQSGQIRVVEDGELLPTPFLDISDRIPLLGTFFDERGLLGLAFHPNFKANGRFFVRYSAPREGEPDEPCNDPAGFIVGCHTEVLSEFWVSDDPNIADPDSEIILFTVDEPQFNHDGVLSISARTGCSISHWATEVERMTGLPTIRRPMVPSEMVKTSIRRWAPSCALTWIALSRSVTDHPGTRPMAAPSPLGGRPYRRISRTVIPSAAVLRATVRQLCPTAFHRIIHS